MMPAPVGERRDCHHPRARHQHGSLGAYRADNCRCPECTQAHVADHRHRARAQITGFWQPYTPAAPVRRHLQQLRDAGIGIDQIARLSGVPGSTIRVLIYGKTGQRLEQVKTGTATRLLAVPTSDLGRAPRSTVDAANTRAQLHDLVAAGLRWPDLAAELGRTTANLRRTMHRRSVTVKTATDIARLHRRLLRNQRAHVRIERPVSPRPPSPIRMPTRPTGTANTHARAG